MSDPTYPFTDFLDFLKSTAIFQDLSRTQLASIAQLSRKHLYYKGEVIFHQGDEATGFFLVHSGKVKVFKLSSTGREQILHIFGVGDYFAEVPAFDGQCFPASAAALENTDILFFPRQFFFQLLEENPTLAINMLKSFARHLRHFSHLVDNLSLREIPGRLASYLLQSSEKQNHSLQVELEISKGQLAALLGTIPETLSRTFYKLNQEEVIAVDGTKIILLNRKRLEQLAE